MNWLQSLDADRDDAIALGRSGVDRKGCLSLAIRFQSMCCSTDQTKDQSTDPANNMQRVAIKATASQSSLSPSVTVRRVVSKQTRER